MLKYLHCDDNDDAKPLAMRRVFSKNSQAKNEPSPETGCR